VTTLLALYRRPDGGDEALATFERRYAEEHLPLIAATPELLAVRVRRVTQPLLGDRELFLTCAMEFEDRAALDRALASDEMRAAGRILREIAPGLATLLVLEDDPDLDADVGRDPGAAASPAMDTVGTTVEERP
jgi:uncharacterized protein (TIGR02118 family)